MHSVPFSDGLLNLGLQTGHSLDRRRQHLRQAVPSRAEHPQGSLVGDRRDIRPVECRIEAFREAMVGEPDVDLKWPPSLGAVDVLRVNL